MKKYILKFGLIGGAIVSLFMALTIPFMDVDSTSSMGEIIGYSSMIVSFSTIFIGTKAYRDKAMSGLISFGKAFMVGLYIALIASTLYVITWMVISDLFMPNFMENYMAQMVSQLQESGLSTEAINTEMEGMKTWAKWYKNPILKALITYAEILPVGILVSLISAGILKKRTN